MRSHDEEGSVTRLISDLAEGVNTDKAAHALWSRYSDRLVQIAWKRLRGAPCLMADEEDAALSAFNSYFEGAPAGRFPKLGSRDDLLALLATITKRKVADQIERERAQRRDRRRTLSEAAFEGDGADHEPGNGLAQIISREPSPEMAALLAEEYQARLNQLPNDLDRHIAVLRMEGHENKAIAESLDLSLRTVERSLNLIREIWNRAESH